MSPETNQPSPTEQEVDREYTLEALMTGYVGIGGTIDGIRNPVLRAEKGETIRITIINGELMPHDIALEGLGISSEVLGMEGEKTSIEFVAEASDTYYCTIPGHRQAGMVGRLEVMEEMVDKEVLTGVLPEKGGRPLNLDFETGTLADWTAEGEAFVNQPVSADPSPLHEEEMSLHPSGQYLVSSGGTKQQQLTGMLESTTFEVTHPFAAFRVSGGAMKDTRVELVRRRADAEADEVLFQITGNDHAALRPVVVDLQEQIGEEIYIRLIDHETGLSEISYIRPNIWAHINFDDFRFYEERPEFLNELRSEDIIILPPRDIIPNAGLSADEAARKMDLPDGFSVQVAASEPDIVRPIAFTLDERGRLWVAEAHTYPQRAPEGEGKDRILIFEDTTGDGTLDSRIVFMEGLNLVSGIEVGFGGVWVGAAPYLLYIPINEEGTAPAGEPEILLDGWGYEDTHETLNSFRWGPDGWLYGLHGVFTHSKVGKPGTAEEEREPLNAGVWRYHPTRHEFEVYAHGTSNPWGLDFNDVGHPFITACVIPHLFHVIQGAKYNRQAGEHFNPHAYDDITTIADHVHWMGDRGPHAGNHRSGEAGGGHAHAGAMFYMGGDHWGQDRNTLFMNNIHGFRVNTDPIERKGSGYTASHGTDFLLTNDAWSQWLDFRYGPGGSVYAIDWYDKNQCHSPNPELHETTLGRIFKISHQQDKWARVDLSGKSSLELAELQLHENDWYVRHARRLLQQRGPDEEVHRALKKILNENPEIPRKLRAMWALHVTDGLSEKDLMDLLLHDNEYIRGWTVQLLTEDKDVSNRVMNRFVHMAHYDSSALVRLYLSSALQRLEQGQRWAMLEGLNRRSEDAGDQNLPLMFWYAFEPLIELDANRAGELAIKSELPNILHYTVQRLGAMETQNARRTLQKLDRQLQYKEGQGPHEVRLSSSFHAEGTAIGDLNQNGRPDVVCGPYWYEGPDFERRHAFYEPQEIDPLDYAGNFIAAVDDVNENGRNDILIVGFPGQEAYWYKHPGNRQGYWERHLIHPAVDNESPLFADLTGDGKLELVFHTDGTLGYAAPDPSDPQKPWTFTRLSDDQGWGTFTHGFGLGDVNGNGYQDILMADGWWENPGLPGSDSIWTFHPADFGPGGAQMYAYDVDGDGLNDVITTLEAHGWGMAWFRQTRTDDGIHFEEHLIMGDSYDDNPYGVRFSQPHSLALVDIDNDGLQDLVSGKRYWAHGPDGDVEPNAPAVLYWFKLARNSDGGAEFVPYLIDDDSGAGVEIATGDLTGNGYTDIATCNKKGGFVFLNRGAGSLSRLE